MESAETLTTDLSLVTLTSVLSEDDPSLRSSTRDPSWSAAAI